MRTLRVPVEGNPQAATARDAVMGGEIADKLKVRSKARVMQHPAGIAAGREYPSALDMVIFIENENLRLVGHTAQSARVYVHVRLGLRPGRTSCDPKVIISLQTEPGFR